MNEKRQEDSNVSVPENIKIVDHENDKTVKEEEATPDGNQAVQKSFDFKAQLQEQCKKDQNKKQEQGSSKKRRDSWNFEPMQSKVDILG